MILAVLSTLSLLGWNGGGDFVFQTQDAKEACAASPDGDQGCRPCGDGDAACEIATPPPKKLRASLRSPDRKVRLAAKKSCTKETCTWKITVDKARTVTMQLAPTEHARLATYFRPDSGAVWLDFRGRKTEEMMIVDVSTDAAALGTAQVSAGFDGVKDAVAKCAAGSKTPGSVDVNVTIEPDGRVSSAKLANRDMATYAWGQCVEGAIAKATFPGFSGAAVTVTEPFDL